MTYLSAAGQSVIFFGSTDSTEADPGWYGCVFWPWRSRGSEVGTWGIGGGSSWFGSGWGAWDAVWARMLRRRVTSGFMMVRNC